MDLSDAGCVIVATLVWGCGAPGGGSNTAEMSTGPTPTTAADSPVGPTVGGGDSSAVGDSANSSSGAPSPTLVEVEGWIDYHVGTVNFTTYFVDCEGEFGGCLEGNISELWQCDGTFARLKGYPVDAPPSVGDGPCGQVFHVTEVLESRLCETTDCGCAEGFDCNSVCHSGIGCGPGFKCAPWSGPLRNDTYWACAEVVDDAASSGMSCTTDASTPWKDDCDDVTTCVQGRCEPLCSSDDDCLGQRCFGRMCLEPCSPLADRCAPELDCRWKRGGGFACVDPAAEPFAGPDPCGETVCLEAEACVQVGILPNGWTELGCVAVCDIGEPDCPAGRECVEFELDEGWVELEGLGACRVPR